MLIIILFLSTSMLILWFAFLSMAGKEDWIVSAYNKVLDNINAIDKLRIKDLSNKNKLYEYHGFANKVMSLFLGGNSEKEITKLNSQNDQLKSGNIKSLSIFDIPGYVLQRKFDVIGRSSIHKSILTMSLELYGKKHAENKAKQLLARLISYSIIGVSITLMIGALIIGAGNTTAGLAVLSIGTILVLVLVYTLYDEISDKLKKRRDAITRQFPNMVSKLALLVSSGMIMDRAWKETAYSQESELYREMQKVSEELDNMVSPEVAYGTFINRCNTKETAKLASALIQNLSKGNAEIGKLLKDMAKEAWLERRHTAKRDSERANSKLMIPTMLLFIAILIIIMVPIAINFTGL